jgi:hypothetical protein
LVVEAFAMLLLMRGTKLTSEYRPGDTRTLAVNPSCAALKFVSGDRAWMGLDRAAVTRCLFGNPFRLAYFNSACGTLSSRLVA